MKQMDFFVRLGADPKPYGVYGNGLQRCMAEKRRCFMFRYFWFVTLAFLRKNALVSMPLATVINDLRIFLLPVLASASINSRLDLLWSASDGWRQNG